MLVDSGKKLHVPVLNVLLKKKNRIKKFLKLTFNITMMMIMMIIVKGSYPLLGCYLLITIIVCFLLGDKILTQG